MRRLSVPVRRAGPLRPAALLAVGVFVGTLAGPSPISAAGASPSNSTITWERAGNVVADAVATTDIVITLKDDAGVALPGVTPTFSATDTNLTNVYGPCSPTGADGVSRCTLASKVAEPKALSITSPISKTGDSVMFVAGPFAKIMLFVSNAEQWEPGTVAGRSGTPDPWTIGAIRTAHVYGADANWNLVQSAPVTVALTSTDPEATLPGAAPLDELGWLDGYRGMKHAFSVGLRTNGSTITATVVGAPGMTSTSPAIPVIQYQVLLPGEAPATSGTCKTGAPSGQTAGAAFTVTVRALDSVCGLVQRNDQAHLASTDPGAAVLGDLPLSGGTGAMNVTLKTAGSWTISATVSFPPSPGGTDPRRPFTSALVSVGPGGYVRLQALAPGETAAPGTASGKTTALPSAQTTDVPFSLTVNAVDASWNVVAGAAPTVRITSSDPEAALPAPAAISHGTGTFAVTLRTAGSQTITVADAADASKTYTSSPITVGTGSKRLVVILPGETFSSSGTCVDQSPSARTAGVAFSVTVYAVHDGCSTLATSDDVAISSSDPYAVLPGNVALSGGTRTFSVTFRTAGARTITATDITNSAVAPSTSAAVAVGAGPFARLQLLVPGETAAPGSPTGKTGTPAAQAGGFAFGVTVSAVDANWNLVSSSDTIRLTSTDPLAVLPPDTVLSDGTRSFSVSLRTTGQTITATDLTDATKASSTSPAISLSAGAAYKLAFTAQPTTVGTGAPFPVSPAVIVKDVNGSAIITNASITLALAGNPTGATLTCSGGLTKSAATGAAIFTGCSVDKAGTYTLLATSSGLLSATSVSFTVGTGVASLTLTPSATTITWSGTVILTVRLSTAYAGRQVALLGTRDGVNFAPIATVTTGSGGTASFSYRPATNLYYRATFAGAPDLAAATSNTARVVVRQIALLRPTNSGAIKSIARGTALTFTTTVRPSRPGLLPASVTYWVYRNVNGVWVQYFTRNVVAASTGVASFTWTFASSGLWYVRSMANATPYNANSVKSPTEQYKVS